MGQRVREAARLGPHTDMGSNPRPLGRQVRRCLWRLRRHSVKTEFSIEVVRYPHPDLAAADVGYVVLKVRIRRFKLLDTLVKGSCRAQAVERKSSRGLFGEQRPRVQRLTSHRALRPSAGRGAPLSSPSRSWRRTLLCSAVQTCPVAPHFGSSSTNAGRTLNPSPPSDELLRGRSFSGEPSLFGHRILW